MDGISLLTFAKISFLLAKIQLDQVLDHVITSEVRQLLSHLPQAVDISYESTLARIKTKSPQIHEMTFKVLSAVLHSTRALGIAEVVEILSVKVWHPRRDPEDTPELDFVLECCLGLVCVESGNLRFAHETAYHYLKTCPCIPNSSYLGKICLTYLLLDNLDSVADVDQLPLLEYAVQNWLIHLKDAGERDPEVLSRVRSLFTDRRRFELIQECCYTVYQPYRPRNSRITSPLHLTARAGLRRVVDLLLEGTWGQAVFCPRVDSHGRTPLHESCTQKNPVIVEALLTWDRTLIDVQDDEGLTALHYAIAEGNVEVINLLFLHGADPNIPDNRGWDALAIALAAREMPAAHAVMDHLFNAGEVSTRWDGAVGGWNCDGYTLLHQAANLGYVPAVMRLLEAGADPNATTKLGTTPLAFASRNGHDEVVALLLSATNNIVTPNAFGGTPLHRACQWGEENAAKALIAADESLVNATTWIGFTPLHWAAAGGHVVLIRALHQRTKLDPNSTTPTPIQLAAWGGHEEAVVVLLEHQKVGLPKLNFDSVKSILHQFNNLTKGFGQTYPLPKALTAGIALCHYYGMTQLKAGRQKSASAWLDLALRIDPVNASVKTAREITCSNKVCDSCGVCPIVGPYFTCRICVRPCYDLCERCNDQPLVMHNHDQFLRVPSACDDQPTLDELLEALMTAMEQELPTTVFSQL